jgi:NADH dehydrogenase (ubiquinone) Fe-S protein 6
MFVCNVLWVFQYFNIQALQGNLRTPIEMLREEPPIKVSGLRVVSKGGPSDDVEALGCPMEFIDLRGSTPEKPAVCKYTGNKYYSDDWKGGGTAH